MNRALVTYVGMIVGSAAGVWGIIAAGSRMSAPHDVSGEYTVVWDAPAGPASPPRGGPAAGTMSVEQSGRYLRVRLDGGEAISLKLDRPGDGPTTRAGGGGLVMAARADGDFRLERTGAPRGTGTATKQIVPNADRPLKGGAGGH